MNKPAKRENLDRMKLYRHWHKHLSSTTNCCHLEILPSLKVVNAFSTFKTFLFRRLGTHMVIFKFTPNIFIANFNALNIKIFYLSLP